MPSHLHSNNPKEQEHPEIPRFSIPTKNYLSDHPEDSEDRVDQVWKEFKVECKGFVQTKGLVVSDS